MPLNNRQGDFSVGVVIPAYNIEAYIDRALESVLAQTHKPDEIIVVDDGSTDQTAKIIKRFGSQVKYIYQANGGLSAARNTGINASRSQWIALLDGDDEWLPEKLENQLEILQRNNHLAWISCNHIIHYSANNSQRLMKSPEICKNLLEGKEYFESYLTTTTHKDIWWPPSTMMIKREVFEQAGMFEEGLRFSEDTEMWFRIVYRWPQIGFAPQPLIIYYRDRPGSLSHSTPSKDKLNSICDYYDRHLEVSKKYRAHNDLKDFVAFRTRKWMREMYFESRFDELRKMLKRYYHLFPRRYRLMMRLLTVGPEITAPVVRWVANIRKNIHRRKK